MVVNSGEFLDIRRNIALRNSCEAGFSGSCNFVVNRRTYRRNVRDVSLVSFFTATHIGSTFVSGKFHRIPFPLRCAKKSKQF